MKRGEIARRTGLNAETLRYYEGRGLIPVPPRTASGYREYSEGDVERIQFIRRAQELGFTLAEILDLLDLRLEPRTDRTELRNRVSSKIESIRAKIEDLERIESALDNLLDRCTCSGTSDPCPILEALRD
jgi:Hg(II)-responsive transcriptional regulator